MLLAQIIETPFYLDKAFVESVIISCIGIIGVIVGSLLSPWITTIHEKSKIKRSLYPTIIKHIYSFYAQKRLLLELGNKNQLHSRHAILLWNQLVNLPLDHAARPAITDQYNTVSELVKQQNEVILDLIQRAAEYEAGLNHTLVEVKIFYGKRIYDTLTTYINKSVENEPEDHLYKYNTLTPEEHGRVAKELGEKLQERYKAMQKAKTELLNKIEGLNL